MEVEPGDVLGFGLWAASWGSTMDGGTAASSSSRSSCHQCGMPRQAAADLGRSEGTAADVGRSEGAVAGEEEEGAWPPAWGRRGRPASGAWRCGGGGPTRR